MFLAHHVHTLKTHLRWRTKMTCLSLKDAASHTFLVGFPWHFASIRKKAFQSWDSQAQLLSSYRGFVSVFPSPYAMCVTSRATAAGPSPLAIWIALPPAFGALKNSSRWLHQHVRTSLNSLVESRGGPRHILEFLLKHALDESAEILSGVTSDSQNFLKWKCINFMENSWGCRACPDESSLQDTLPSSRLSCRHSTLHIEHSRPTTYLGELIILQAKSQL